ncbi:oligo-1,6-glucosidase [mine drainage metagenome]|uniref:Oligo-1,6-glucosidase n=1 Tax=mine drainage metagenome TaxID=410659 RepID=A0A1J5QFN6_9ZZZZ
MTDKNWWRQAAIYQIYPRSFKDSNGNGLGDIKGITSKVEYLQSLSLDAIWLSPFYPSALADGGYDVDDYRDVDPRLGTLADFDNMVKTLHTVGIRVFVDIVPNHSSNRHVWFKEALASAPGSVARDRYIFRDGKGKHGELPPSDWISHFAPSAWTRTQNPDGTPGQWYLHLFAPEQPDFNWDNREVQLDFLETLRFWSDRGVDGFRIDVAHALKKDMSRLDRSIKSLNSFNIVQDGTDTLFDRNDIHAIYREWREVFDQYDPPRVAVAEAYVRAPRRMLYAKPDELGQAFNFDLLIADYDAKQFKKIITTNVKLAKSEGSSSTWVLDNHDQVRHATKYGLPKGTNLKEWLLSDGSSVKLDRKLGLQRARAASMLLMALPGCVYIYQGEELGLFEVEDLPHSALQDPHWTRNVEIKSVKTPVKGLAYIHTEKGRDGCRVPLPWESTGPSFGFGTGGSHLPQPKWFEDFAVAAQSGVKNSTLELYREALALRKKFQSTEALTWVKTADPEVLHFARENGWHCIMNFSGKLFKLPDGKVVISSGPLKSGQLPKDTCVWIEVD